MEKAEILSLREQEVFRVQLRPSDKQVPEIRLNEEQQATYEEILRHIHGGRPGVTLLQGVTGSGKRRFTSAWPADCWRKENGP